MKLRLIVATLFVVLFSHSIHGQGKWEAGYILTLDNDTVYGQIEEMDSRYNAKKCNFKSNPDAVVQVYGPEDILGYRFTDSRFYVSKTYDGPQGPSKAFMEFLIHGMLNVYHLKEGESRFFVEKEGKLYELINSNKTVKVEDVPYNRENKEYMGILNYLLQDGDMSTEVQKSELNSKSLINIAKEYHEKVCTTGQECIIYEKDSKPMKVRFGLHGGLSLSKIQFGGMSNSNFSMGSMAGVRLEIENPFEWSERFTIVFNVNVHQYTDYQLSEKENSSGSYIELDGETYLLTHNENTADRVQTLDVNIKTTAIRVPIMINYTFSRNKFMPYVGAGLTAMYVVNQNTDFQYRRTFSEFNKSIPAFHIGFNGSIGTKYLFKNKKGFYLEGRYEYTSTLNINQILRVRWESFSGVLGFTF